MSCREFRHRADRAFTSCRKSMQESLGGKKAPSSLAEAERLRNVCTDAIRDLRTVKTDTVDFEERLRREMVSAVSVPGGTLDLTDSRNTNGDSSNIVDGLESCAEVRDHIDQLIAAVVKSKSQASSAIVAYRRIESRDDQPVTTVRSGSRVSQQLAGLAALHRSGSLNDEEFMLAKRRL